VAFKIIILLKFNSNPMVVLKVTSLLERQKRLLALLEWVVA
jgi:hypothetical protein